MKTVNEYNDQIHNVELPIYVSGNRAGVCCPKCIKHESAEEIEMVFSNPHQILTSIPPKQTVVCPKCNYTDYKIV